MKSVETGDRFFAGRVEDGELLAAAVIDVGDDLLRDVCRVGDEVQIQRGSDDGGAGGDFEAVQAVVAIRRDEALQVCGFDRVAAAIEFGDVRAQRRGGCRVKY